MLGYSRVESTLPDPVRLYARRRHLYCAIGTDCLIPSNAELESEHCLQSEWWPGQRVASSFVGVIPLDVERDENFTSRYDVFRQPSAPVQSLTYLASLLWVFRRPALVRCYRNKTAVKRRSSWYSETVCGPLIDSEVLQIAH